MCGGQPAAPLAGARNFREVGRIEKRRKRKTGTYSCCGDALPGARTVGAARGRSCPPAHHVDGAAKVEVDKVHLAGLLHKLRAPRHGVGVAAAQLRGGGGPVGAPAALGREVGGCGGCMDRRPATHLLTGPQQQGPRRCQPACCAPPARRSSPHPCAASAAPTRWAGPAAGAARGASLRREMCRQHSRRSVGKEGLRQGRERQSARSGAVAASQEAVREGSGATPAAGSCPEPSLHM